jgi:hypothetical protein
MSRCGSIQEGDKMNRLPEFKHKEAFMLMLYKCQNCGTIEVLWNSRDGITPFCIECSQCEFGEMRHIMWGLDVCNWNFQPFIGQRIFTNKRNFDPKKHQFNVEIRYYEEGMV